MKFAFFTLGCKVNLFETQALTQLAAERGHEIVERGADALSFLPEGVYDDPRVTLRLDTEVVGMSAIERTVTLADAASCPLLLREPGSAGREIVESLFLSGGIQIAPAWESVSTLALIRAAQNGLGIAI